MIDGTTREERAQHAVMDAFAVNTPFTSMEGKKAIMRAKLAGKRNVQALWRAILARADWQVTKLPPAGDNSHYTFSWAP